MEKKAFVLLDPDIRYGERFREYAERKKSFLFPLLVFTRWEELKAVLPRKNVAGVLAEEAVWRQMGEEERRDLLETGRTVFLLCRDREASEEIPSIYKYQSLEDILREILSGMEGVAPLKRGNDGRTEFVAVCSPGGGWYRTVCALALGQILAEREAVLYVNLEALSGMEAEEENSRGLSDILYLGRLSEEWTVRNFTGNLGGLDVLSPVVNPEDIWETSSAELAEILTKIGDEGIYDRVILNMGEGRDPLPILRLCRRLLMPVRGDPISRGYLACFMDYLGRQEEEEIPEIRTEVEIPENAGDVVRDPRQFRYSALGQLLEREAASW